MRSPGRCAHGSAGFCLQRHEERDEIVGSALCGDCYDYEAAVMFNATAGELWRRVTIYARRHLAYCLGMLERELKELVRLSYVKVAELQHRGVVHLHAIVRADAAENELQASAIAISPTLLAEALVKAVRAVYVEREVDGRTLRLKFGEQLKVDPLEPGAVKGIASYFAKYLSKGASDSGALDHRLREGELEYLELPDHLRSIVEMAWQLGAAPELSRLRRWAHALAYTGHLMTKSRRYSTTFSTLRAARQAWQLEQAGVCARPEPVLLHWSFEGAGYRCAIDAVMAATAAENRLAARRERWDAATRVGADRTQS